MTKWTAYILSIAILCTLFSASSFTSNATYSDMSNHWAGSEINKWSDYGILKGQDGAFRPNNPITRAEMATVISKLLGLKTMEKNTFVDLNNSWYTNAILECAAAGILKGDGGMIRPNDYISREESAVMLGRALGIQESASKTEKFRDISRVSPWAQGAVYALAGKNIINGYDGLFMPEDEIDRASVVAILDNAITTYINKPGTYSCAINGITVIASDNVVIDGANLTDDLIIAQGAANSTVSLVNSSIQSTVQINAENVKVAVKGHALSVVKILGSKASLSLGAGTRVGEIQVSRGSDGVVVNADKGASIGQIVSDADKVAIGGQGTITSVKVNGNGTAINTPNTNVIVAKGVKGTLVNSYDVSAGANINTTTFTADCLEKERVRKKAELEDAKTREKVELENAKIKISTQISMAKAITSNKAYTLYDWAVLQRTLNAANAAKSSNNLNNITAAMKPLEESVELVKTCNEKVAAATSLAANINLSTNDSTALINAVEVIKALNPVSATIDQVKSALAALESTFATASKNIALTNAKDAMNTQIEFAEVIMDDSTNTLYDWAVLTNAYDAANVAKTSNDIKAIAAATEDLRDAVELVNAVNEKIAGAVMLTASNFKTSEDYITLTNALTEIEGLNPASAATSHVLKALNVLSTTLEKAVVTGAEFTGTHIVSNLNLNASGLNMQIKPPMGYSFKTTLTDEVKKAMIDNMTFDYAYGLIDASKGAVPKDVTLKTNKTNIDYIESQGTYFVKTRIGTDTSGDAIYQSDGERYLSIGDAIKKELKANLDCITISSSGNIEISCDTEYFKNFNNLLRLVNGNMPFAFGDLPVSLVVPAGAVKQGVALETSNTFDILETKAHIEVWEYVEASRAGEDGVVQITNKSEYYGGNYEKPYYIKRVKGDVLTESDIRNGGTDGPSGTGKKLIKVCVDSRTGPTKWAFFQKADAQFLYNAFRTSISINNYGLAAIDQDPVDNSEWMKIENKILSTCTTPNYVGTSPYYVNNGGDHRYDQYNPYDMWYFVELPKISDFDISTDLQVYVNQLQGMTGGSGGGGNNPQGIPFWGMDGRCYFTIDAD